MSLRSLIARRFISVPRDEGRKGGEIAFFPRIVMPRARSQQIVRSQLRNISQCRTIVLKLPRVRSADNDVRLEEEETRFRSVNGSRREKKSLENKGVFWTFERTKENYFFLRVVEII